MKKSERYQIAMLAVVSSQHILADAKLEIIETLMGDKAVAKYCEEQEDEKNG